MRHEPIQDMVREFHKVYARPIRERVAIIGLSVDECELRYELIREELEELRDAMGFTGYQFDSHGYTAIFSPVAVADALGDLLYVVYGAAVQFGITDLDAVVAEIHRSNMTKLGENGKPIYRDDGKVMKGPNCEPPNLTPIVYPSR